MRPILCWLLLATCIYAQDVVPPAPPPPAFVELPATMSVMPNMPIILTVKTNCTDVLWESPDNIGRLPPDIFGADNPRAKFTYVGFAPPGVYKVGVYGCKDNQQAPIDWCTITVGTPTPVDPTPGPGPGPGPGPLPPDPFATSDSGVSAAPAFRVLIVYESGQQLPVSQAGIWNAEEVRSFAEANCLKGPSGRPEFRVFDQDVPLTSESLLWQKVMKRPRASLPWIVIGTGVTGYEGPLPSDLASLMALLRKYNG